MFTANYPDLVAQTFVTGNADCKFDFSANVWHHLPRDTLTRVVFVDPRHHLAVRLPQIYPGEWPKEFSTDDAAPSVCSGDGPELDFDNGDVFEILDERPAVQWLPIVSHAPSVIIDNRGITRRYSNDTTHGLVDEDGVCEPVDG
jgi:hypothetical protein